jgi:non-homologous end joining protein Ku
VIDLMEALKASLDKKPLAKAGRGRAAAGAKREAAPPKRAQAGRK